MVPRFWFRLLVPLAFVWAGPLMAAGADDTAYDIRLQRPFKAGQSFSLSTTDSQRTSQRVELPNGNGSRTSYLRRVLMDADIHMDKVDEKGLEVQTSITLRKLTLQVVTGDVAGELPAPMKLLEPGTEITLTYAGNQANFKLKKDAALSSDALSALNQAFQRMALTDALYGAAEKKKVGDSWPLNVQALPNDRTDPQAVDPSQVSGKVTLKGAREIYGQACVQLEGTQTTKDLPVPGVTPKEATSTTAFSISAPVALDKPMVSFVIKVNTHIVVAGSPQGQSTLMTTADSEVTHEATWIAK